MIPKKLTALLICILVLIVLNLYFGYASSGNGIEPLISSTEDYHISLIKKALISVVLTYSCVATSYVILNKTFDYAKIEGISIYFQLMIVCWLSWPFEGLDVFLDMKLNKICKWLRRCEFVCWSTHVIITEFKRHSPMINPADNGIVYSCYEKFENMMFWKWILLLGQVIIGLFPYPIIMLAVLNFGLEVKNINWSTGFTSLLRVGSTLLRFALSNRLNMVVLMDAYCTIFPTWPMAGGFAVTVLIMRVTRGLMALLTYIILKYI
ncbi:uncharacterized protein LOC122858157 [Aphidius gifuensis]|uniref:uncharacterized protein LOC122858157 n=1 Tax=Aphidius gifuensis TaxID=684658 RepID=UPI001CDD18A7|nr:uncharacterized protein LOC122858157 [Aphidius gifuensis]